MPAPVAAPSVLRQINTPPEHAANGGQDAGGDTGGVRRVSWREHRAYLHATWRPGMHCSIITETGGGKSHLSRALLAALWTEARVIVIDPTDDTEQFSDPPFKTVPTMPTRIQRMRRRREPDWFRVVPDVEGRDQVRHVLEATYAEGSWVVDCDELKQITDARAPGFGLAPYYDQLMMRARKRRVTVIAATQAPVFVPNSFYNQPKLLYVGFLADARARKRLEEISGANTRLVQETVAQLDYHEFLFVGPGKHRPRERMEIVKAPA